MSEQIKLEQIRRDGGTQSRAGMNGSVVYEYADLMKDGQTFPDITVFFDGKDYWLADGYHRHAAAVEAGLRTINADVQQGTQRDAVLFSVGANSSHGLRRTNDDKRRAVMTLLKDEEWVKWSDREIARRTGVDHKTVARLRSESGGEIPQVGGRVGGDGKTYTVKHWSEQFNQASRFWERVKRNGLDEETVIAELQRGAKVLTDLKIQGINDALSALNTLALEHHKQAYPAGTLLKHHTGRFGRVTSHAPDYLEVDDFLTGGRNYWQMNSFAFPAEGEWEAAIKQNNAHPPVPAATNPPDEPTETPADKMDFEPGDQVATPTGHDGEVVKVVGRNVDVKTKNGTKTYNRAFLTLLGRAGEPGEPPQVPTPQQPEAPLGVLPWTVNPNAAGAYLMDAQGRPVAHVMYSARIAESIVENMNSKQAYQSEISQEIIPVFRRVMDFAVGSSEGSAALLEDIRQLVRWFGDLDDTLESQLNPNEEKVS